MHGTSWPVSLLVPYECGGMVGLERDFATGRMALSLGSPQAMARPLFQGPLQSFFQDCGALSLLSGGLGCFQLRATSHPPDLARAETRPFPQGAPPNKDPSKLARSFFGTRAD